jgi:hypothetical protein
VEVFCSFVKGKIETGKMRQFPRFSTFVVAVICVYHTQNLWAQSTPQPIRVPGPNRIEQSADGKTFIFSFAGIPMYRYETMPGGTLKGNFVGLSASRVGNDFFIPSMCGGVLAVDGDQIVYPCDGDVSYRLERQAVTPDSVSLLWNMQREGRTLFSYWMSFRIQGKTLVIDVVANVNDRNSAGMTLGEAGSPTNECVVVPIPCMTLTSLLYQRSSGAFVSMYFDWERTNCSRLLPLSSQQGHSLFASSAEYFPRTDGKRNPLKERIYLTISENIDEVMPNVVGPIAPLKSKLEDKIVVSYHWPFQWLLRPIIPGTNLPSYLDTLARLGITDLALIVKDWWWSGFDRGNPRVLPANDFSMRIDGWDCSENERLGGGGNAVLRQVRDKAHSYGYLFGLHQNYVDMYSSSRPGGAPAIRVDSTLVSRLPGVGGGWAWALPGNCRGENAWSVKPSRAARVAGTVSSAMYKAFTTDWNYLDVTSSMNPSGPMPIEGHGAVNSYVDFDASASNADRDSSGMFRVALNRHRRVAQAVRDSTAGGPVEGEGGNHFLYAGYFDDIEARIKTASPNISGYAAPLFVDFHLRKLRGRSAYHGTGHIYEFFNRGWGAFFNERDVLTFIATELAYGVGGLVTKSAHNCRDGSPCDHSLVQIALENRHLLPMQKLLANAQVKAISYFDREGRQMTASEFIAAHPDEFANIDAPNFMGRVRVEYDNGTVTYVNRSRAIAGDWVIRDLPATGRYNYNTKLGDGEKQGVGTRPAEPLVLPPENGWVCYSPE